MSESKFTPGPWIEAGPSSDGITIRVDSVVTDRFDDPGDLGDDICIMPDYNDEETNVANASLIAAAPDMYAVLKDLEESVDYWSEYDVPIGIVDRIKAALAKAEGKNHE